MFCELHILIYPQNAIREPIRNHPRTVLGFGIWELDPVFGHRYAFGYSFLVARAQNPSTSQAGRPGVDDEDAPCDATKSRKWSGGLSHRARLEVIGWTVAHTLRVSKLSQLEKHLIVSWHVV